jgi:hypothetical protein
MMTLSCSKQQDTAESEITKLKERVETVTVGYEDGSTIPLNAYYAQYEEILNECLSAIVSIDEHVTLVLDVNYVEEKWKPTNEYVQIVFDGLITLVTKMLVQEEERYHIPTNADGFRVLTPKTVIFPLSDDNKGLIWLTGTDTIYYGVWENTKWSYLRLEKLVDELLTLSPIEFTKITAPLTLNGEEPGTDIPWGSVVYHWANGITEVYGADNKRIFIALDSEATQIAVPGGLKPATHIYQVPSGANITKGESDNITEIYLDEVLILTVIEKSEDFTVPPRESNFNLIFKYGVMAKNELNTFNGTYTRDMVSDPSITVELSLTEEELDSIYEKMVEIDFFNYPDKFAIIVPFSKPHGIVTPYSSYYFKIQHDSEVKELWWADEIIYEDIQADKLTELINLIRDIIESKDEYKELPEPTGGYM